MKRKGIKKIGLLLMSTLLLVACSPKMDTAFLETRIENLEITNQQLLIKISNLEKEIEEKEVKETEVEEVFGEENVKQTELWALENKVNEMKEEIMELEGKLTVLEKAGGKVNVDNLLILYTKTANTSKEIPMGVMDRDKNLSLKEQLQVIADEVSRLKFGGIPLQILDIQNIKGKQIAIVNLQEPNNKTQAEIIEALRKDSTMPCWIKYSDGSTGSDITYTTIAKSLLQPDYKGEWIDGMKLLYNGEEEFIGHLEAIGDITYRD